MKYTHFILATDFGETTIYNYRSAFSAYQHEDDSATLYGVDEQGDFNVIFSK